MKLYLFLALLITALSLGKYVTGYSPLLFLKELCAWVSAKLKGVSGKQYRQNRERFARMNQRQKKESYSYQYHIFLNEILLDMGWHSKYVTVEGLNLLLQTASALTAVVLAALIQNILLAAVIGFVLYTLLVALLFLVSRMNHTRRKNALMDAEDLLCSTMSNGLITAVEDTIQSMDYSIQPVFKRFLDEIYNRNMDIGTAIDNLNLNCGSQFDLFCDKAKTFERERRPGMETVFQYNISRNSFVRILDRECSKAFQAMNRNYLASLSIIVGFLAYNILSYDKMAEFYFSSFGKLLLSGYFMVSALTFIYIQYIQSKPFRYGTQGNVEEDHTVEIMQQNGNRMSRILRHASDLPISNPIHRRKGDSE